MPAGNLGISTREIGQFTIVQLRGDDIAIYGQLIFPTAAKSAILNALNSTLSGRKILTAEHFNLG